MARLQAVQLMSWGGCRAAGVLCSCPAQHEQLEAVVKRSYCSSIAGLQAALQKGQAGPAVSVVVIDVYPSS